MKTRWPLTWVRFASIAQLALAMSLGLGGCAGGAVDACPYVRNENPSLLQGRGPSAQTDAPSNPAAPQTESTGGVTAKF